MRSDRILQWVFVIDVRIEHAIADRFEKIRRGSLQGAC